MEAVRTRRPPVESGAPGRRRDAATARLWDAASGKEVAVLRGHGRPVLAASFNRDGTRVVTAAADDTARVWRVFPTTQELIDYARKIVPAGVGG